MTRSLKVRSNCIQQVELAVKLNGFSSQKALAEDVGLALSTLSNFIKGKPIDRVNFLEICRTLGLDWKEIAELRVSPGNSQEEKTDSTIFILHRPHNPDRWLAQQFYKALNDDGHEVFLAGESVPASGNWLQQVDEELMRCDYLLLLLSPKSAVSEMVTEQVRRAKELYDLRLDHKPVILIIRVGLPLSATLNHDLHGYLQKTWQREWQPFTDAAAIIQEVKNLLKQGGDSEALPAKRDRAVSDEIAILPTSPSTQENLEGPPVPAAAPELPEGR